MQQTFFYCNTTLYPHQYSTLFVSLPEYEPRRHNSNIICRAIQIIFKYQETGTGTDVFFPLTITLSLPPQTGWPPSPARCRCSSPPSRSPSAGSGPLASPLCRGASWWPSPVSSHHSPHSFINSSSVWDSSRVKKHSTSFVDRGSIETSPMYGIGVREFNTQI